SSGHGSLLIRADARDGLDGHWTKTFPVHGGEYYRFCVLERLDHVATPRRSALVRILWRDDQGRAVRRDEPSARSYAPGEAPVAEPEYPAAHDAAANGWNDATDMYRVAA